MNVSLKLESGILLSVLHASHLTKLELDLGLGWDSAAFLRLELREEGRRLRFRWNPQICCFVANSRQRALTCWAPILVLPSPGCCPPQIPPPCWPSEGLGVLSLPLSKG